MVPRRVVVDTNVFVSSLLSPDSTSAKALRAVLLRCEILSSHQTFEELTRIFERHKFEKMAPVMERRRALDALARSFLFITIDQKVAECRDHNDNQFLELALCGKADLIITGDHDLLVLHPWRGIPVLTPAQYLASWASEDLS